MKYSIVYSSKTGNTAMLAESIKNSLDSKDIVYYGAPNEKALVADDIFIGFWTDKGTCDEELKSFLSTLKNKNIYLFGTAGFGGDEKYFERIIHNVTTLIPDSNTIRGSFMCQGKMPLSVKKRYEQRLKSDPENPQFKAMVENFGRAVSHPDAADLNSVKNLVKKSINCSDNEEAYG